MGPDAAHPSRRTLARAPQDQVLDEDGIRINFWFSEISLDGRVKSAI
jgi:hypothetical protein